MGRIRLEAGSTVARNGLNPFDITSRSGARIVAIEREGAGALLPSPQQRLEPGDVLVVLGPDAALAAARTILHADPEP